MIRDAVRFWNKWEAHIADFNSYTSSIAMLTLGSEELVLLPNPWEIYGGAPFIPYHLSQWHNLSWAKHVGWVWKSEFRQSWGHLTHCSQRKPDYYLTPFIYWVSPQKALSLPYTECLYFVFKMYWKEGRGIYNTVIINASVSRWYRPQWNVKILVSF